MAMTIREKIASLSSSIQSLSALGQDLQSGDPVATWLTQVFLPFGELKPGDDEKTYRTQILTASYRASLFRLPSRMSRQYLRDDNEINSAATILATQIVAFYAGNNVEVEFDIAFKVSRFLIKTLFNAGVIKKLTNNPKQCPIDLDVANNKVLANLNNAISGKVDTAEECVAWVLLNLLQSGGTIVCDLVVYLMILGNMIKNLFTIVDPNGKVDTGKVDGIINKVADFFNGRSQNIKEITEPASKFIRAIATILDSQVTGSRLGNSFSDLLPSFDIMESVGDQLIELVEMTISQFTTHLKRTYMVGLNYEPLSQFVSDIPGGRDIIGLLEGVTGRLEHQIVSLVENLVGNQSKEQTAVRNQVAFQARMGSIENLRDILLGVAELLDQASGCSTLNLFELQIEDKIAESIQKDIERKLAALNSSGVSTDKIRVHIDSISDDTMDRIGSAIQESPSSNGPLNSEAFSRYSQQHADNILTGAFSIVGIPNITIELGDTIPTQQNRGSYLYDSAIDGSGKTITIEAIKRRLAEQRSFRQPGRRLDDLVKALRVSR